MAVHPPEFTGTTGVYSKAVTDAPLTPIKGGPFYPINTPIPDVTVIYATFEYLSALGGGETVTYNLRPWPEYEGQLMWCNIISVGARPSIYSARLFLAIKAGASGIERDLETGAYRLYKWIPVRSSFSYNTSRDFMGLPVI
jgi:hypothetical protein